MSLIHWWSLNGNITDNGVDNFTLSATPSFSATGKIGKCATNTIKVPGNAWFIGTDPNVLTVHILSIISITDSKELYGTCWDVQSVAESGYNYVQVTNDLYKE